MNQRSLQQRLFLVAVLAALPVFLVHVAVQIFSDVRTATAHTEIHTAEVAAAAIPLLQSTLIVDDLATAQETLDNIMRLSQFDRLQLLDADAGLVLAEGRAGTAAPVMQVPGWFVRLLDFHFPVQQFPISAGGTRYGTLVIEPSALFLSADIWRRTWTATLLWLITLAFTLLLLKAVLRRGLRPLEALAAAAHRFGDGELTCRAPVSDVPELAETALAFNQMADNLAEARDRLEQRVRQATRELENLITRIPAGVYKLRISPSAAMHFEYVSPRWCEMLDLDAATVARDPLAPLARLHPDDVADYVRQFDAVRASGEPFHWEGRREPGAPVRWLRIEATPTVLDDGDVLWEGIQYDISDAKETAARLEAERIHLHTVLCTIPDLVWLKDTAGVYRNCNPAFADLFGAPEAQIVGRTDFDFMPAALAESLRQKDLATVTAGHASVEEQWLTFHDGHRVLFETITTPMRDAAGSISGVLGIGRDITERRRMEEALRRETAFRQRLMEATPGVLCLFDSAGRFLMWNHNLETVSGRNAAEIGTLHPLDFFDAPERSQVEEAIRQAFATGEGTVEASLVARDGTRTPHYFNGFLIDLGGRPALLAIGADISARKQAEEALRASEEKLRGLFELSPLGIALTDMQGRYVEFNEAFRAICGYSAEELRQLDYWVLTPRQYAADEQQQLESLRVSGRYGPYEKEYRRKDGALVSLYLNGMLVQGPNDEPRIWSIVEDITRQKHDEAILQQTIRELDSLIARIPVGVYKLRMPAGGGMHFDYVSPRWCDLLEIAAEQAYRDPAAVFARIHPDDRAAFMRLNEAARATRAPFEWEGRLRDGLRVRWLHIESIPTVLENGDVLWEGIQYDISATKEREVELDRIAHYDALTGVPNRMLLADRMQQALSQAQRNRTSVAVCYLDLDGFKPVNDTLGHEAGDLLLIEVARRLLENVRGGDTVARIGGDEFVLLLVEMERMEEFEASLNRILEVVSAPFRIGPSSVSVSVSIGIALYPQDDADPDILLRHADQAMYQAKMDGRNKFHFFDLDLEEAARRHRQLLLLIESGMSGNEFELHYQPKVNMRHGTVIGFEALVRWRHPEKGLLMPKEFLPLIEDNDLIIALGEWVIDRALAQLGAWHRQGLDFTVSVNVAPRHLQQSNFVERLRQRLAIHADAPPDKLEIEIVETSALADTTYVAELIDECSKLGISFALDDFGTGYSSLSYLKSLPAQTLKIDQSFVRDMFVDANDLAIVEGVIGLTEIFRRQVIAEGVESTEHGTLLLNMGCELAQGYGIAHPMPAAQVDEWLRTWRPDPAWSAVDGIRWPRDDLPLVMAQTNHRAWIDQIVAYLDGRRTEPPELDDTRCRFGQWHAGFGRRRYGRLAEFAAIERLHTEVHGLGRELSALVAADRRAAAQARLPQLLALRDQLLALMQRLMTSALNSL